jgi:hypothetical protein
LIIQLKNNPTKMCFGDQKIKTGFVADFFQCNSLTTVLAEHKVKLFKLFYFKLLGTFHAVPPL